MDVTEHTTYVETKFSFDVSAEQTAGAAQKGMYMDCDNNILYMEFYVIPSRERFVTLDSTYFHQTKKIDVTPSVSYNGNTISLSVSAKYKECYTPVTNPAVLTFMVK